MLLSLEKNCYDRRQDKKMRYRKPKYYSDFQCIAGSCPDTCCAGWQIVIDEESLEKYGKIKSDFGTRLLNSIDWYQGIFEQYNRRCSFLNEIGRAHV